MGDQALKDNAKNESYTPKPITYNTNLEKLLKREFRRMRIIINITSYVV